MRRSSAFPHAVLACVIAAAGFQFLILSRLRDFYGSGPLSATSASSVFSGLQEQKEQITALVQTAGTVTEIERNRLASALPDHPRIPEMISDITDAARDAGIVVQSLTPARGRRVARDDLPSGVLPLTVGVSLRNVSYTSLRHFIQAIERSSRLYRMTRVTFSPGAGTATAALVGYYYETQ